MRFYCLLFLCALPEIALHGQIQFEGPPEIPGMTKGRRTRSLPTTIMPTIAEAQKRAEARKQVILVYVNEKPGAVAPDLFNERRIAIASRINLTLHVTDYVPGNEFFKNRYFKDKHLFPCYFVLDYRGNILKRFSADIKPDFIIKQMYTLKKIDLGIESHIPKVLEQVNEAIEAQNEQNVLKIARPWLQKHYRGYSKLDQLAEAVRTFALPSIETAVKLPFDEAKMELEAIATQYQGTPVEAEAKVTIGELYAAKSDMKKVKAICEHVLQELPWPENVQAHDKAKKLMRQVRRAEILRRRKILEAQRKQAANQQKSQGS